MKFRLPIFTLLLLLRFYTPGNCQQSFTTISGKITDATTGKPVAYANIQLKKGSSGTVSNAMGFFVYNIKGIQTTDSVLISCIGYKPLALDMHAAGVQELNIKLHPAIIDLPVVSVSAPNALEILKAAIKKIPENYDTSDARLTAFYRENIQLGKDTLNFNESILDIYKTFHHEKNNNDQLRIIKGRRKKVDLSKDPQLYGWLTGITNTAYSALLDDIAKYTDAKTTFLNPRNFRYYTYSLQNPVVDDNRKLLVLSIRPKVNNRKGFVNATLFIDEASLAIVRCEYATSPAGTRYLNHHGKGGLRYTIMSKVIKATFDFTHIAGVVSYKKYKDKYYLNTVQRNWDIIVNSKKRGITDMPWKADFTLLVTDVSKDSVQRFTTGVSDSRGTISSQIGSNYDAAFWENYNILQPALPDSLRKTEPVSKAAPAERVSNRRNGFTHADTLRGYLSPLRSCYDVTFYDLDADVDMTGHAIKGSNKIRFKVTLPFDVMQIDLYENMKIEKILFNGTSLNWQREANAVFVHFPGMQPAGSEQEITVFYEGIPQVPDRKVPMKGGVLWDKDDLGNPWAQVVCQGSGASLWWPCKDHLSDEPDSMMIRITVPEEFTEISNGQLLRKVPVTGNKTRYEWRVSYPVNNYNATFSIGKYAHYTDNYNGLKIDYYVMPYNLERAKTVFEPVKPMLACFEKYFGPYPFKRDGLMLVESLYPMEHQSGVCIGRIKQDVPPDNNPLLWHETAHEWWGNAITCKDIADMWMHEAFATYAEAMFIEDKYGKEEAGQFLNAQKEQVKNTEPVTGVYNVNHIFYDIGDMYTKGSLMLNTLRHVIDNDTLWFGLLKGIQQHFRYQTLSAAELTGYINQHTGKDYRYFFDQYLNYTAIPKLQYSIKEQGHDLVLKYRWRADAEGFIMPVKVAVAADKFRVIYPSTEWKTTVLKNVTADNFEVDEEHFYIETEEVE